MSLAINATTPEGIVLAADSRQSYRNQRGMARVGSDNASKLFRLNDRIGVAITGLAFLLEDGTLKSVSKFVEQFRQKQGSNVEKLDVKEVAEKLQEFFNEKYDWEKQLEKLPEQIKTNLERGGNEVLEIQKEKYSIKFRVKDPSSKEQQGVASVDSITILVAGFNKDGSHQVYICSIPGEIQEKRNSIIKGNEYGASWIGQIDVVSRIVLGFDGRIGNLNFMKAVVKDSGVDAVNQQLRQLEYVIQWGAMTLQDAMDFCALMIKTTSAIQRFSDGVRAEPGDIPGVGGAIDVAVLTPDKGFVWVSKKILSVDGSGVDLEKIPNLE